MSHIYYTQYTSATILKLLTGEVDNADYLQSNGPCGRVEYIRQHICLVGCSWYAVVRITFTFIACGQPGMAPGYTVGRSDRRGGLML